VIYAWKFWTEKSFYITLKGSHNWKQTFPW
jgi:hypothetical protein